MSNKFKVGDRVTSPTYPTWGEMKVLEVLGERSVFPGQFRCEGSGCSGIFEATELLIVPELTVENTPQPVHFRICVGTQIGTKEYPTLEAAKEAAVEHGNANEEFSIFEVVLIASYVVKAAKYLEEK